jgi:uncharacterized membrane protein HdeD (DUF308 family)
MLRELANNWWALLVRGVLGILFGVVALTMPEATLTALVIAWGFYALVSGMFAIVAAVSGAPAGPRWVLVLEGAIGIAAAAVTFFQPRLTGAVLLFLIAAWALIGGVLLVAAAFRLRREITGEIWLGLAGLVSVAFGVFLFAQPGAGAMTVVWLIGLHAIVFGILWCALAARLHGIKKRQTQEEIERRVTRLGIEAAEHDRAGGKLA